MPAHAIHHVNIRARPALVAELKRFYERVLGLAEGWRPPFASTGHWMYLDGEPVVHLVEDARIADASGARGAIVDHVAFACTGLSTIEASLAAQGVAYRKTQVPATSLVLLNLLDPAGNGVELQFDVAGDGDAEARS